MVTIPFIYFTILFLYHFFKQHREIDIASYILLIYLSSAFFSILVEVNGFSYYPSYRVSLSAALTYCGLLTISVMPFMKYSNLLITHIKPLANGNILKYASVCLLIYFFIYLYMSANDVYNVLNGDIAELRAAHYTDNISSGWLAKINPVLRIPFILFNLITGSPWILQFLAFYTIIVQKLPMKYGSFFLISSLIGVIGNLSEAGRSDIVYWLLGVVACFIFYKPYIRDSSAMTKKFKFLGYALIVLGIYIVGLITFSRFSNRSGGAEGGFISYYGQAFNHFAFFFDNFECPYPTLEILFPFTYDVLGIGEGGVVNVQQMLTLKTGVFTGLFYTYIGQIAVTSSNSIAALFCFVYSILSFSICKKMIKRNSIKSSFLYMLMASVMFLGLFSHYYGFMTKTASALIWYIVVSYYSRPSHLLIKR